MTDTLWCLNSSMADIAAVMQFFGVLYLGTPFIGTYGESSLAALERRRGYCVEALGADRIEALPEYVLVQNSLDDLRIALDAPVSRGRVRHLFALAIVHIALGLPGASVAELKVPSIFALPFLLFVGTLYLLVGGSGLSAVLTRERAAVGAMAALEIALGRAR